MQPEQRQGNVKIWPKIPFRTYLIIGELLRLKILLRRRQHQELVARTRQERLAVAAIERNALLRLHDYTDAWADFLVSARERAWYDLVGTLDLEPVISHADNNIDMFAKADLVLSVSRYEFYVGNRVARRRTESHCRVHNIGKVQRGTGQRAGAPLVR